MYAMEQRELVIYDVHLPSFYKEILGRKPKKCQTSFRAHLPRSTIHFLRFNESHSIRVKPVEIMKKGCDTFYMCLFFRTVADIVKLLNHINHFTNIMKLNSEK